MSALVELACAMWQAFEEHDRPWDACAFKADWLRVAELVRRRDGRVLARLAGQLGSIARGDMCLPGDIRTVRIVRDELAELARAAERDS